MAQSPEYPDLTWMPPKSWTDANRSSVQLVVIHTTEGSARGESAEDGAGYDQRRTDGTSTHYFHDGNSTVQCVRTADQAHAARAQGNRRGIQHELCTRAGSANWGDVYHQAMLQLAAKQAARDAKKWGIPVRHLTVAQVAGGDKGFCGHVDVTYAFPQDGGTHTDPGPNFPWTQFLAMVRDELEDDMPTAQEIAKAVWDYKLDVDISATGANMQPAGGILRYGSHQYYDIVGKIGQLTGAVSQVAGKADQVDTDALVAALAPALAAAVVAQLPPAVDVTTAELTDAIVGALKVLVTPQPADA